MRGEHVWEKLENFVILNLYIMEQKSSMKNFWTEKWCSPQNKTFSHIAASMKLNFYRDRMTNYDPDKLKVEWGHMNYRTCVIISQDLTPDPAQVLDNWTLVAGSRDLVFWDTHAQLSFWPKNLIGLYGLVHARNLVALICKISFAGPD